MKTFLRIIGHDSEYIKVNNPLNVVPIQGSYIVVEKNSYVVSYSEFDFDLQTLFIVTLDSGN